MDGYWSEPTHTGGDGCIIVYGPRSKRRLRFLYWLRNLRPLPCRKMGYWCEWVYPYGFVPEGGCPIHD